MCNIKRDRHKSCPLKAHILNTNIPKCVGFFLLLPKKPKQNLFATVERLWSSLALTFKYLRGCKRKDFEREEKKMHAVKGHKLSNCLCLVSLLWQTAGLTQSTGSQHHASTQTATEILVRKATGLCQWRPLLRWEPCDGSSLWKSTRGRLFHTPTSRHSSPQLML